MFEKYIKPILPHLLAIAIFLVAVFAYFKPVLDGKVLQQGDVTSAIGMHHEIKSVKAETGTAPLWTNSMFGGMPAYQISAENQGNLGAPMLHTFRLFSSGPANMAFSCLICMYILLCVLKLPFWIRIIGAFGFAFSTYNFLIIEAGHLAKVNALAWACPLIAGILLIFKRKYLWGLALTALSMTVELRSNHIQVTYYLFFILLVLGIVELVYAIRENKLADFGKAAGIGLLAIVLGMLPNASLLWSTSEYSSETMRGGANLQSAETSSGLDKGYAYDWSYGVLESFNLLIPNFSGGASGDAFVLDKESNFSQEVSSIVRDLQRKGDQTKLGDFNTVYQSLAQRSSAYWGAQPFTGGPTYLGAGVIFLFILGLFLVKGKMRWWLAGATIIIAFIAWGKNMPIFSDLMFNYFPLYNKFRAVSMAFALAAITMPILGCYALYELFYNEEISKAQKLKYIKIAGGIVGGICMFLALFCTMIFDFTKVGDFDVFNQYGYPQLLDAVVADRASMLRMDAFRSLAIVLAIGGLLYVALWKQIKTRYVLIGVALLVTGDLVMVSKRWVNNDDFVAARKYKNTFKASTADKAILKDPDPYYRVFNIATGDPFQESSTSYFHKSVGGYHAAKLMRYEELKTNYLLNHHRQIIEVLTNSPNRIGETLGAMGILNMLNTKYLIINPEGQPLPNSAALGNAWFVGSYEIVKNNDAEILSLDGLRPQDKAIIHTEFSDYISDSQFNKDISGGIQLTSYHPDHLVYSSNASSEQLAVFSEIWYGPDKGWQAYIDGQPVDHIRSNYVLRAMKVPAGQHEIEFKFEPTSYYAGVKINYVGSLIVILLFGFAVFKEFRNGSASTESTK